MQGQALALAAARESIVLLQNEGGILPLRLSTAPKAPASSTTAGGAGVRAPAVIAMIGEVGSSTQVLMGGKSDYCPQVVRSP